MGDEVITNTTNSLELSAPTVFLVNNAATSDGILKSFQTYFTSYDPVELQIWRPTEAAILHSLNFTLVFSFTYFPSAVLEIIEVIIFLSN